MITAWHFYRFSKEAWDGMYETAAAAERSIDFEQFIFMAEEQAGARFADLFIKKAKEGVAVRLLCDMVGSYDFFASIRAEELRRAGVEIVFFNIIKPWRFLNPKAWLFRDHRKLMIVDSRVALIGGVGIADAFADWRDTHMRITGPLVAELMTGFEQMWRNAANEKFIRFKEPRQTHDGFTAVTNAPHWRQRFMNRTVLDAMRNAERCIFLATPYFVPDARFFRVLRLAARRGVDVRLIVPTETDHPIVDRASRYFFSKALQAGVRIFLYGDMLHAKTVIIDNEWGAAGSSNIDNLSTSFNYELNVASVERKFVEDLGVHFIEDLARCRELSWAEWRGRSFFAKFLEFCSAPFGRFF